MRPIKFRAWDKNDKVMLPGWNLISDDRGVCEGGWFGALDSPHAPGDDLWASYDLTDIELMQFTGLLDKNGKEIYEGDIVKYNTQVEGAPPKWSNPVVIEWRQDRARFDWHEDWPKDWSYNGMIFCAYEVIGNIYSNPELVK